MPFELGEPGEWRSEEQLARDAMHREIINTGACSNPVHLRTISLDKKTGELRVFDIRIACKDRRAALCSSCAARYRSDAFFLAVSGLVGGKGLPSGVANHPRLFATLTAPSFGAVHTVRDDGRCRPRRTPPCEHGSPTSFRQRHGDDDVALGAPLCERCFDYEGAVVWNAMASALWHRTVDRLRRPRKNSPEADRPSTKRRLAGYLASRQPERITEAVWLEVRADLSPVSDRDRKSVVSPIRQSPLG